VLEALVDEVRLGEVVRIVRLEVVLLARQGGAVRGQGAPSLRRSSTATGSL
jgi:hypothetical protein